MAETENVVRAIIADDEEPSRKHLKSRLLTVWPDLVISGEAENGIEAKEMIETILPDIAFLDIKMPGLTGIEVARETADKCRIVFITAFDQYAVDAFENEAIDYILKPATIERLEKTVKRLKASLPDSSRPEEMSAIFEKLITEMNKKVTPRYLKWVKVQIRDTIRFIPADQVYFFKASHGYTAVMTEKNEALIKKTITELADELDPDLFVRIHRGTIVNVKYIDRVSSSPKGHCLLRLIGRPEVHRVSRSYTHLVKHM